MPDLKTKGRNQDGEEEMMYDLESILKHHLTPSLMRYVKDSDIRLKGDQASEVLDNIKAIGCGAYHTFAITVGDRVYSCGLNNYSQLGLGDTDTRPLLHEVTALRDKGVVMARGGVHHSCVLTRDGKLYSFGRGDSGQLGVSEFENKAPGAFSTAPLEVTFPSTGKGVSSEPVKVTSIACGGNHNLALTSRNDVYSWGYGDMLALGHGEERDEMVPRAINLARAKVTGGQLTVTQVSAGGQHSAIIGEVVSTI